MMNPVEMDKRLVDLEERHSALVAEHNTSAMHIIAYTEKANERISALENKLAFAGGVLNGFLSGVLKRALEQAGPEGAEALKQAEKAAEELRSGNETIN